jgi:hypothetical protein
MIILLDAVVKINYNKFIIAKAFDNKKNVTFFYLFFCFSI